MKNKTIIACLSVIAIAALVFGYVQKREAAQAHELANQLRGQLDSARKAAHEMQQHAAAMAAQAEAHNSALRAAYEQARQLSERARLQVAAQHKK